MKILCVFGKYQYGNPARGLSTEYFSFVPAFKALEHEVIFFDSWDRSLYADFKELNQKLIDTALKEKPDVVFSVQLGYEIWLESWEYIRANTSAITINWATDDSWKFKEHSKFIANSFDLNITTYASFIKEYEKIGANVYLSGWGAPQEWLKEPKKATECKYKVSFVGTAHGDRKESIEKLKECGIDVVCFGYGWENGAVSADEIPSIFNDSIISLNFANSKGENQIKARTFEVCGSGGFLLTEPAPNLENVFDVQNEIAVFKSLESCAEKIKYFFENLELRDEMAKKSYKRTIENYTYKERLKNILEFAQKIEKKKVDSIDFQKALDGYYMGFVLSTLRFLFLFFGKLIFGKDKGTRFARRAAYELSWRLLGEKTYMASGYVGRMFYRE